MGAIIDRYAYKSIIWVLLISVIGIIYSRAAFCQVRREFERIRAVSVPGGEDATLVGGGIDFEYYLAPGDSIEIFVWQNPDLSREVTIRPDGKLSYPLVGTISAAGSTIDQLQDKIKEKLSEYIRFPEVTISITKSAGHKIIILGEVNFPGIYTYTGTMNLLEGIALAGDFTRDGKRESVIVVSGNLTKNPSVRRVNLFRAIRRGTAKDDIVIRPNDVVYVPRTFIADVSKFMTDIDPAIEEAASILDLRTQIHTWYKHWDKGQISTR